MINNLSQHPSLLYSQDLSDICSPLNHLNISYFAHVHVDTEGKFSAICSNPQFFEHYMKNKYYNVDIHVDKTNQFGEFVIWDAIEVSGLSAQMDMEASEFGLEHSFTILEKDDNGNNYYHFSTHLSNSAFVQVYLTNYDLLKKFIIYFKEKVKQSKYLSQSYDITFNIDDYTAGYAISQDEELIISMDKKSEFMKAISSNAIPGTMRLIHKDTGHSVALSRQQTNCLNLIVTGHSIKESANILNLSARTIEHYFAHVRKILGCRNNKELMSTYLRQIRL